MNPEPEDLIIQTVSKLPDSAQQTTSSSLIDLDVQFITIINRWQPMGYRLTINLPFVADDINPICAIQITPFIPPVKQMNAGSNFLSAPLLFSPVYPLPSTLSSGTAVTVTRYDNPPSLAVAAAAHRFWRGTMKYRLRCVSNFIAQGYVIASVVKGLVAEQNGLTTRRRIQGLDVGMRRFMGNSYIMSDVSMFRHIEIEAPFEYPVQFYDTFRSSFEQFSMFTNNAIEINCPDNFVLLSSRGGITSPTAGAQVVYELEYAPGADMEFSTEMAFSSGGLQFNNFNTSNSLVAEFPATGLPYTYPTS